MNAQIIQWQKDIVDITADVSKTFGGLTAEQLNRKPNAESWSIAQCLDHLIVTNNTYPPIIEKIRNGEYHLPFVANFSFLVNFFGKLISGSVEPARKRKTKTFPIWQPQQSNIGADIVTRFVQHQQELKAFIASCADLLEKQTIISSPANNIIVYKLDVAFDIIIQHERRHYNQALEVLKMQRKA